ncbi:hypothetical protein BDZ91DRAFT_791680 [Kalaharituber pfeilii]|nr:hypothetical protein BDZ91DRAFT_791680 [Kalaharituber pfeilii]
MVGTKEGAAKARARKAKGKEIQFKPFTEWKQGDTVDLVGKGRNYRLEKFSDWYFHLDETDQKAIEPKINEAAAEAWRKEREKRDAKERVQRAAEDERVFLMKRRSLVSDWAFEELKVEQELGTKAEDDMYAREGLVRAMWGLVDTIRGIEEAHGEIARGTQEEAAKNWYLGKRKRAARINIMAGDYQATTGLVMKLGNDVGMMKKDFQRQLKEIQQMLIPLVTNNPSQTLPIENPQVVRSPPYVEAIAVDDNSLAADSPPQMTAAASEADPEKMEGLNFGGIDNSRHATEAKRQREEGKVSWGRDVHSIGAEIEVIDLELGKVGRWMVLEAGGSR